MAKVTDALVATQSFACDLDGETVVVQAGTRVHASHPLAKAHVHLFEDEPHVDHEHKPRSRGRRKAA
jgi:hypothetical protein